MHSFRRSEEGAIPIYIMVEFVAWCHTFVDVVLFESTCLGGYLRYILTDRPAQLCTIMKVAFSSKGVNRMLESRLLFMPHAI
jgi:hypothetical protein